jgi:hypothetical protein
VVHHLLDEDGGLIEYLTDALRGDPAAFDRALERCCDVGAAEFLMPRARVRALIVAHGFSVDLAEQLAGPGRVSVVAAAVQLAACAPVECYVAVGRHGPSPLWPHDLGLHVEQAATRPGMGYPWLRGTAIPPDHLFHAVWQSKRPLAGPSFVPFRSRKRFPCGHAEARLVGGQVVGVLYLGHLPRKEQLSLDF